MSIFGRGVAVFSLVGLLMSPALRNKAVVAVVALAVAASACCSTTRASSEN